MLLMVIQGSFPSRVCCLRRLNLQRATIFVSQVLCLGGKLKSNLQIIAHLGLKITNWPVRGLKSSNLVFGRGWRYFLWDYRGHISPWQEILGDTEKCKKILVLFLAIPCPYPFLSKQWNQYILQKNIDGSEARQSLAVGHWASGSSNRTQYGKQENV